MNSEISLYNQGTNGDYSIHLVRVEAGGNSYLRIPLTVESGDTITFTADIYTPNNLVSIEIYDGTYSTLGIPKNNEFQTAQITKTVSSDSIICYIQFKKTVDCYFDNINIRKR